jgi:hypothetical protein
LSIYSKAAKEYYAKKMNEPFTSHIITSISIAKVPELGMKLA